MEAVQIRNVVELVTVSKKAKEHLTKIKSQFVLTFEELYILVYIYKGEKDCYNVKDIIKIQSLSLIIYLKQFKI